MSLVAKDARHLAAVVVGPHSGGIGAGVLDEDVVACFEGRESRGAGEEVTGKAEGTGDLIGL